MVLFVQEDGTYLNAVRCDGERKGSHNEEICGPAGTGGFRYRSPPETDASRPLGAVLLRPAHLSATGPVRTTSQPTLGPPIPALDTCLIIILLKYLLRLLKIPSCREKFAETLSKVKTPSEPVCLGCFHLNVHVCIVIPKPW